MISLIELVAVLGCWELAHWLGGKVIDGEFKE